jgi:predicted Zn-dependent protease
MSGRYYPDPNVESRDLRRVVISLILFFSSLILGVVLIFINAQSIARSLPFETEQRFIRPYEEMASYFTRDNKLPPRHAEIEAYLSHLSAKLGEAMEMPESYTLSIHYLDSDMINAFAMLGGHVFVTRGLLGALDSENSLSLVLAHELAHVKHRDPLAGMGRGLALQLIFSFITGQSGRGSTIAASGGELGLLHFSRDQEAEADVAGMRALYQYYGHVEGADGLFKLLIENNSIEKRYATDSELSSDVEEALQGWLSSHPELDERLGGMNRLAKEERWPTKGKLTPIPVWIKEAVKPRLSPDSFAESKP